MCREGAGRKRQYWRLPAHAWRLTQPSLATEIARLAIEIVSLATDPSWPGNCRRKYWRLARPGEGRRESLRVEILDKRGGISDADERRWMWIERDYQRESA
jgi:hypothetical protein